MASRQETISFIKSNYRYEEQSDGLFKLIFETESERTQLVFLHVFDSFLIVLSPFAQVDDVSAKKVFEAMDEVSIPFGLRLIGNLYSLAHVVLLENVDPNEITVSTGLVSAFADKLENALGLGDNL